MTAPSNFLSLMIRISTYLPLVLAALTPLSTARAQTRQDIEAARNQMVEEEIIAAGVENKRVIEAMRTTPRHEFVSLNLRKYAYVDMALPIGESQTISPPFVVAFMTEQLDPQPTDKVLEIGTGSGYQAAVLAEIVDHVHTIEIVEPLGERARRDLERLGYDNVTVRVGDGFAGWPEQAPFDAIVVTAAPEEIPPPLIEQLAEGGRLVIPVGDTFQELRVVTKSPTGLVTEDLMPVRFVPMTGRAQDGASGDR